MHATHMCYDVRALFGEKGRNGVRCVLTFFGAHPQYGHFTADPRRLCIFAHCPESLFVPQLHPGNQNAVIREGALEASYLRRVVIGTATPVARL